MVPTLAAYPKMLENGRRREGLRLCRAAWLLGMTVRQYRELLDGRRYFTCDEYERACRLYDWPERYDDYWSYKVTSRTWDCNPTGWHTNVGDNTYGFPGIGAITARGLRGDR